MASKKKINKATKNVGRYAWNYLKMTNLFPDFKKKKGDKDAEL
jgi:hypothetical protein